MKHKYICEFCGQEFNDPTDCVVHEHSHNCLYINNKEIEEYGIMHSGYRAGQLRPCSISLCIRDPELKKFGLMADTVLFVRLAGRILKYYMMKGK